MISDGQGGFTSTLLERTDDSYGVTSGDWNGDGLMDAMVVNRWSENEILISDGQGGFTSTLLERTDDSYGVTSGDWNGDGLMDAMVVNSGSENEILISDGQGGFTSTLLERTDDSYGVTSGDWNGDGLMDAMVVNSGSENEILISDGQGGFTSTLLERTDDSIGVTSGDWNGDGLMDAMVANLGTPRTRFCGMKVAAMAMRHVSVIPRATSALATRPTRGFRQEGVSYVPLVELGQDMGLVVTRDSFAFHARPGQLEASTQPSALFVKRASTQVLARQHVKHAKVDKLRTPRARAQLAASLVVRERDPTLTTPHASHARARSTASRVNAKIVLSRMS